MNRFISSQEERPVRSRLDSDRRHLGGRVLGLMHASLPRPFQRSQRQEPRSGQQIDGGGAIAAVTVTRALSSNAPIWATARAALVTGPAYLPTLPTLPTSILACPCDSRHNRKMGCYRVLRKIVAFPTIQNSQTDR